MSSIEQNQRGGARYWQSLDQLADTPQVRELMEQEFPGYDPASMVNSSRRRFLKLMGASMALAGLTLSGGGCRRWPQEHLAPYTGNPQGRMPGVPEAYATCWDLGGVAQGLLVSSYDNRPTKVEGNPNHPSSWVVKGKYGSADVFAQASVLDMYDPERSREVIDRTGGSAKASDWSKFAAFANTHFRQMRGSGGGFAILSESSSSPTVADMKRRLLAAYPQAKWYEYEPLSRDNDLEGSRQAFGKPLRTRLNLDKANVIVSLDADLLGWHPNHTRYAADWSEKRRSGDKGEMNRVYIAETRFSITGTVADVRLALDPNRLHVVGRALARAVGVAGVAGAAETLTALEQKFVTQAAEDLKNAKTAGAVAVGESAPPALHALAHAINQQIGALGQSVTLVDDPAGDRPTHIAAITELAKEMAAGNVGTLLILGGNPAYDAPVDTGFADALGKVHVTIRLGLYEDETSARCHWHLPRAHYLESWGDGRGWDGTAVIQQPLIMPLFDGKSVVEVLAMIAGDPVMAGDQIVQRTWREQLIKGGGDFGKAWRKALESGVLEGSEFKPVQARVTAKEFPAAPPAAPKGTYYLKFEPDAHAYDGRFANNAWLQEIHEPLTKLIWDNAAMVSVKDAKDLGLTTNDVIRIERDGGWIEAAAFVMPGQPVGVIGLSLGYGRTAAGSIGNRLGFNAYTVRKSDEPYSVTGVKVSKSEKGEQYTLVTTSLQHLIDEVGMKGREERIGKKNETGIIVREGTLDEYKRNPKSVHGHNEGALRLQLFDPPSKFDDAHAWGMTIDLNTCIGCNACVAACQAENNVPVVGKDQAKMHRAMHWLRIDRYFKGDAADPQIDVVHQPMMCVHCENAPCEQVCPVAATMHNTEGLNTMVYNRCIGTRYCSNNCPYKVRRFNYFDWHAKPPRKSTGVFWPGMPDTQQDTVDKVRRMQFNPDVTVRMRGVMEKCTYCTQRIQRAKINTRNAGEDVKDGDILTACQQACPTRAIVFGNLKEKTAEVTELQKNPRAYDCLGELNTRPRTRYLAKLRNPGDEGTGHGGGGHGAEGHGEKA